MMSVNRYIKEMLYKVDVLPIERLGTFTTYETPSRINQEANTIEPPRKAIRFKDDIEGEVNHLLTYIQEKDNVTLEQAKYTLNEFVDAIKQEVKHNFGYTIDGVGTFIEGNSDDVRFIPDPQANFNLATYGLTPTPLPKHVEKIEAFDSTPASVVVPNQTVAEPYIERASVQNGVSRINEVERSNTAELNYKTPAAEYKAPVVEETAVLEPEAQPEPLETFSHQEEIKEPEFVEPVKEKKTVTEVLEEKLGVKDVESVLEEPAPPERKKSLGILGWLVPLFLLAALVVMIFQIKKSSNTDKIPEKTVAAATTTDVVASDVETTDEEVVNVEGAAATTEVEGETSVDTEVTETDTEVEAEVATSNESESTNTYTEPENTNTTASTSTQEETPKYNLPSSTDNVVFTNISDVPSGYYAITGAFRDKNNADKNCRKLIQQGHDAKAVLKNGVYRISIFLANDEATGVEMLQQVRAEVKSDAWLINY